MWEVLFYDKVLEEKMSFKKTSFVFIIALVISLTSLSGCMSSKIRTHNTDTYITEQLSVTDSFLDFTATPEFVIPTEENDGRLVINIKLPQSNCYSPGDLIPIRLEYKNLTSGPLQIIDFDVIAINALIGAKAQIFPFIYYKNGLEVFTPEHFFLDQVAYMKETKTHSIKAGETFSTLTENYSFPPIIIDTSTAGESQKINTPPGDYLIQFKYVNIDNPEYWDGVISSNVLEICIK